MVSETVTENPLPSTENPHIVVIGLGYVGLPLAARLAEVFETTGLDVDAGRIAELRDHHDRTGEIDAERLAASALTLCDRAEQCAAADVYIVTVPTPVDANNMPDLTIVRRATEMVGAMIDGERKPIIVYESTVYPGVTEDICGPILEQASGLTRGEGFFLGYSPERINPGDREHTVDRITKVVAGENPEITRRLCAIYGRVTSGGTFAAASIGVAEAAKVIENAQRDINIAFVNEVARITAKLGMSVWDVLAAANTKWNFLPFQPGLVGGHCIGVDPYYLAHRAEELGHSPAVILAGRAINDSMGAWVADCVCADAPAAARILVLGLTFKENVPDLRNSKVVDVIARMKALGHSVAVHDPRADAAEARHEYGIDLLDALPEEAHDVVLIAVAHDEYRSLAPERLAGLVGPGGTLGDLKNIAGASPAFATIRRWSL